MREAMFLLCCCIPAGLLSGLTNTRGTTFPEQEDSLASGGQPRLGPTQQNLLLVQFKYCSNGRGLNFGLRPLLSVQIVL